MRDGRTGSQIDKWTLNNRTESIHFDSERCIDGLLLLASMTSLADIVIIVMATSGLTYLSTKYS